MLLFSNKIMSSTCKPLTSPNFIFDEPTFTLKVVVQRLKSDIENDSSSFSNRVGCSMLVGIVKTNFPKSLPLKVK